MVALFSCKPLNLAQPAVLQETGKQPGHLFAEIRQMFPLHLSHIVDDPKHTPSAECIHLPVIIFWPWSYDFIPLLMGYSESLWDLQLLIYRNYPPLVDIIISCWGCFWYTRKRLWYLPDRTRCRNANQGRNKQIGGSSCQIPVALVQWSPSTWASSEDIRSNLE